MPATPGIERDFASVPTSDTERRAPFGLGRNWTPTQIEIFGHAISVDIATGNLMVSTNDVNYPYHGFSMGIARRYDAQEQHMQLSYLRNYSNVNPKPHWFGNWQFGYEADIDEVWHHSYPEIHINSGVGANGLFRILEPDFRRNLKSGSAVENLLRGYGIPGQTLTNLGWSFTANDFLLRTVRGPFQIITGHFRAESLVDDIDSDIWLFSPTSGAAFRVSSTCFFNVSDDRYRDVGPPLLVTKVIDALGHLIELQPTGGAPPFTEFLLVDGSGRTIDIKLGAHLTFPDGLKRGREIRKHLVSQIIDGTRGEYNSIDYSYDLANRLERVAYPSSLGNWYVRYHYDHPRFPGVLRAIENSFGEGINFDYTEDPLDNDDRLNPRLKIATITDPEGIAFVYDYDHENSRAVATVSQGGYLDRRVTYEYIRDAFDTRKRYISITETEVRRGYAIGGLGAVNARDPNDPQVIRNRMIYTSDGRFNVAREIDSLNRMTSYVYNDYNQAEEVRDFEGHFTRNTYDIPAHPSVADPRRYDLLLVEQENLLHQVDELSAARPFVDRAAVITTALRYALYDANTSDDPSDHGAASTHRVRERIDPRHKVWTYTYDDAANTNPLSPTLIESPLHHKTQATYDKRGERLTATDAELNVHAYTYKTQGMLDTHIDPNGHTVTLTYFAEAPWLQTLQDQRGKLTIFQREVNGRLKKVVDPVHDEVDYEYLKNGRVSRIVHHRQGVPSDPNDAHSPSLVTPFPNLVTTFAYTPLGGVSRLRNPKELELVFDYDEAGRICRWYHNVAGHKVTVFAHDAAGQLQTVVHRNGGATLYTYYDSGHVRSVHYPDWNDGAGAQPGKVITYHKYDYFGRVLTVEDSEVGGTTEFGYDEAGNLVVRRDADGREMHFAYDDDGRLSRVEDANGEFVLDLTLDPLGRPTSLHDSDVLDGTLEWHYDYRSAVGPITNVLNLYRRSLPAVSLVSDFDYDERGAIKSVEHAWSGAPPSKILAQTFRYRDDGLIDRVTGHGDNRFRYDGIKQLIFEEVGNLTADYDQAGNRLFRVDRAVHPARPSNAYTLENRLQKDEGLPTAFTHDDNGNIQSSTHPVDPTEFHFDGRNQLRVIRCGPREERYLYDEGGKLVVIEHVVAANGGTSSQKTRFRYFGSRPIHIERDGNPLLLLTWDPRGALLRIRRFGAGGNSPYPHSLFPVSDGFGSVVRLADANQDTLARVKYDAWGISSLNDPDDLFGFWGYRGGLLDRHSGLVLFGARWYWPEIGRWISEDPSVEYSSDQYSEWLNLYKYARNSPTGFVDPSGLQAQKENEIADQALDFGLGGIDAQLPVWQLLVTGLKSDWLIRQSPEAMGVVRNWGLGLGVIGALVDVSQIVRSHQKGDTKGVIMNTLDMIVGINPAYGIAWKLGTAVGSGVDWGYTRTAGQSMGEDVHYILRGADEEQRGLAPPLYGGVPPWAWSEGVPAGICTYWTCR